MEFKFLEQDLLVHTGTLPFLRHKPQLSRTILEQGNK